MWILSLQSLATAFPSSPWMATRPWAAVALLLPLLLLLLSLRRPERSRVLLGTARFFRGDSDAGSHRARRRWTASRIVAALALVAATGALVGLAPPLGPPAAPTWTVVLDRSPSMHLEHSQERTRLEVGVQRALRALEELPGQPEGTRVVFLDGSAGGARIGAARPLADAAPAAAFAVPPVDLPEPPWGAFDRAGVMWVRDGAPAAPPEEAGWVSTGGSQIPGAIGFGVEGALHWTGEGTELHPDLRPRLRLSGDLPTSLVELAEEWAAERGVEVVESGEADLIVEGASGASGARSVARTGRDGWNATVELSRNDVEGAQGSLAGMPWLEAEPGEERGGERWPLVSRELGRLTVAPFDFTSRPAPPDAFAVSMARLLDGALRTPAWVVPLEERRAAGDGSAGPPSAPVELRRSLAEARRTQAHGERVATAVFALVAAALAALAAVLRARGSG